MMKHHGEIDMSDFEIVFSKIIQADDFFDAVDAAKELENSEILTVSLIPPEVDDDDPIYDG